jgi:hypothetical protein
VSLDCAFLSQKLASYSPRAFNLGRKRRANIISSLRFALRRMGICSEPSGGVAALSCDWRAVWNTIDAADLRRYLLLGFFVYCSRQHIGPHAVEEATVVAYVAESLATTIVTAPRGLGSGVVYSWNLPVAGLGTPPVQKLTWTSPRPPYVIKLGNYPNSFQEDVARFQAHVGPGNPAKLFEDLIEPDPDAPVRPDRPLRASSVELRVQQILLAAAALVHSVHVNIVAAGDL